MGHRHDSGKSTLLKRSTVTTYGENHRADQQQMEAFRFSRMSEILPVASVLLPNWLLCNYCGVLPCFGSGTLWEVELYMLFSWLLQNCVSVLTSHETKMLRVNIDMIAGFYSTIHG